MQNDFLTIDRRFFFSLMSSPYVKPERLGDGFRIKIPQLRANITEQAKGKYRLEKKPITHVEKRIMMAQQKTEMFL